MKSLKLFPDRSVFVLGLGLVALVIIDDAAYRGIMEYREWVGVVNRHNRVIATLNGTMADLISAESEVRGYVITANEQSLSLYRTALGEVHQGLSELDQMIIDSESRRYLGEFAELSRSRLGRLEITLSNYQEEGFKGVRQATGPGKVLMDESRRVASMIEARQLKLLGEREQDVRQVEKKTINIVISGSSLAVIFLGTSIFLLTAEMRRRSRLEREVLKISEREQRRIGQDLHDGLCQHLTGISLLSRSLRQKLSGERAGEVEQITRLINESIEQTRLITRGLLPVPNEKMGLMLALRDLAEAVERIKEGGCTFECPFPLPIPEPSTATNLYRIAQEATQNALKHADARHITIRLRRDAEAIVLEVMDDGRGFPAEITSSGLGLEIMNYRAESINASLQIRPRDGGGTVVACILPLASLRSNSE